MEHFKILNFGPETPKSLDQKSFAFSHNLKDHPALSLENLAKIVASHPSDKLLFSDELNKLDKNFDYELDAKKEIDFQKIVETIKTSKAYVAIKNPELHESFKEVYKQVNEDLAKLLVQAKKGTHPIEPMFWIFIASPNAITPFHIDRYTNFIMQVRGSKELAVYPPRSNEVVPKEVTEAYISWTGKSPLWKEETDHLATKYFFKPGEAVHIPFTSGHYVKNGPDDISITISIFFHTEETVRWTNAMKLNNLLRRFKINTRPVDQSRGLDQIKANLYKVAATILGFLDFFNS